MKADLFAEQYATTSSLEGHRIAEDMEQTLNDAMHTDDQEEYNRDITHHEIQEALKRTKNTAPGLDKIPNILLKSLPESILKELLDIFNQSFTIGEVPENWKTGLTIPLLKPGKPPELTASYRPVTLLSCIGKLIERIMNSRLEYIVEKNSLLNDAQTGFRKERGTYDCLIGLEHDIRDSLGSQKTCLALFIDLKNAFDKIWPLGLIYKLAKYGIKGKLLKWLKDYLTKRTMYVDVNGTLSDRRELEAGVPQGAVLSPLLFNIMISDIPHQVGIKYYIYADDISITCSHENPTEAKQVLENYIEKLLKWTEDWGLIFNPLKTYLMVFTRKKNVNIPIRIRNQLIKQKKEHVVLGMMFDSPRLSWAPHLKQLKTDCLRRIDIMKCLSSTKWGASSKILRMFYIAYIRAKIDYGSIIYGGTSDANLKKLEIIQNSCLRLILGARKTSPILSMQAEANIPPLGLRRSFLLIKYGIKSYYLPYQSITKTVLYVNKAPNERIAFNSAGYRLNSEATAMRFSFPKKVFILDLICVHNETD